MGAGFYRVWLSGECDFYQVVAMSICNDIRGAGKLDGPVLRRTLLKLLGRNRHRTPVGHCGSHDQRVGLLALVREGISHLQSAFDANDAGDNWVA